MKARERPYYLPVGDEDQVFKAAVPGRVWRWS